MNANSPVFQRAAHKKLNIFPPGNYNRLMLFWMKLEELEKNAMRDANG